MSALHFAKEFPCAADHLCRQSRKLCNVDTVAFINSAADYLSQETYISAMLVNGNAVIFHALKFVFQTDKLMVMRCEKSLAAKFL